MKTKHHTWWTKSPPGAYWTEDYIHDPSLGRILMGDLHHCGRLKSSYMGIFTHIDFAQFNYFADLSKKINPAHLNPDLLMAKPFKTSKSPLRSSSICLNLIS